MYSPRAKSQDQPADDLPACPINESFNRFQRGDVRARHADVERVWAGTSGTIGFSRDICLTWVGGLGDGDGGWSEMMGLSVGDLSGGLVLLRSVCWVNRDS